MEVQPQLVLLQKTLLNIEGLGRELYPELDLWKTGKPFLERWVKERLGTKRNRGLCQAQSLALGRAVPSAHQHTSFDSTTHGTPGIDTAAAG